MLMGNLEIIRGDITRQEVDAIVNAANSSLLGGGGVDGAIHAAGGPEILAECRMLRRDRLPHGLPAGQAVATGAGRLPARWVIHAVGPVHSSSDDRTHLLESAYRSSLDVAAELGAQSVAFPAISAGAYGWPRESAAFVAVGSVADRLDEFDLVRFVLFSDELHELFLRAASELL
jgi:O-acetyl-ADP-ribose deacetylase (regulator of RNase III)